MSKYKAKLYLIPNVLSPDTEDKVLPLELKPLLNTLSYFLVEELKTARRYLSKLKLDKKVDQLHFFELNKDTPARKVSELFEAIPLGENVGVISEAGCPGIADPGSSAVLYAHKNSIQVVPIPGPNSILLALIASGLNGQSFTFHGYLPIEKNQKAKVLKAIEADAIKSQRTQIFMETPYRNQSMIQEILEVCGNETLLCIAADITGKDEFIQTKMVRDWKKNIPEIHKIPAIFLINT